MLGTGEILVLVSVGILVLSAKKLPQLGRALRDSAIGFKKGIEGKSDQRPSRDVTPSKDKGEDET